MSTTVLVVLEFAANCTQNAVDRPQNVAECLLGLSSFVLKMPPIVIGFFDDFHGR